MKSAVDIRLQTGTLSVDTPWTFTLTDTRQTGTQLTGIRYQREGRSDHGQADILTDTMIGILLLAPVTGVGTRSVSILSE